MTGMIWTFIKWKLAGIWPLLWHFGLGGTVVIGCILLWAFTPVWLAKLFPNIQRLLIIIIAVVTTMIISTAIGVSLGEHRIQAQWDQSLAAAVEAGKQAHDGAVRDVARKPRRWLRNDKPDGYDRDKH